MKDADPLPSPSGGVRHGRESGLTWECGVTHNELTRAICLALYGWRLP
jgi:hypothetical protein